MLLLVPVPVVVTVLLAVLVEAPLLLGPCRLASSSSLLTTARMQAWKGEGQQGWSGEEWAAGF